MSSVKLFAVASNEGAYLAQWIHHHLYFGFDEIEIALNRNTDNSIKILDKINTNHQCVKIKNIDELVNVSLKTGKHFQIESYLHCLASAKQHFDYVMFLDLDEYWVPKNFSTNINNYISVLPQFDTLSFLWHIDFPEEQVPFEFPFSMFTRVYKDRHVKSLISTKKNPIVLTAHNAVFESGIAKLADYGDFIINNEESHFNSILSSSQFDQIKDAHDSAYIYHRIFKSQIEYLSSLLRNSPTYVSHEVFKKNRNGYYKSPETPFIIKNISKNIYKKYFDSWEDFVFKNSLEEDILQAQKITHDRAITVAKMVTENQQLLKRYEEQLFGCEDIIKKLYATFSG